MRHFLVALALCIVGGVAMAADVKISEPNLIPYVITDDIAINHSLTGKRGDAAKGREVAVGRRLGNCLACHKMPIPEHSFHGETGPSLFGVANRLTEGEIRLQVVNSKVINEESLMPSFYRVWGFNRQKKEFIGKTILSAQQVEDVVAYLKTLNQDE